MNSTNYRLTPLRIRPQVTKLIILIKSALTIFTGKTSDITLTEINEIRNHDSQAENINRHINLKIHNKTRYLCLHL